MTRRLLPLLVLALLALLVPEAASAQDRHPGCDSEEAHRFDFWAGEWDVQSRFRQPDGSWRESDQEWTAREVVGGCVFIDFADGNFNGQGRTRGMGTRYYDPASDEWVITWISTDAPGQWGEWRGNFDGNGVGDFLQERQTPNGTILTRIRWTDLTESSAHWEYGVSQDGGENWTTVWIMDFTKRSGRDR